MQNLTTIELFKEDMKFAAGHYTIFSPTHREKMHGHNFNVHATITAEVDENGMAFDYGIYKSKLRELCRGLSEYFLIAGTSPYQRLEEDDKHLFVHFHDEKIPFLKKDALVLPIANVTVEELSRWFIDQLTLDTKSIEQYKIHNIVIKVFSGPGQSGSTSWQKDESIS